MNIDVIKKCPLFAGVPQYSITPMLGCLRAREKHYGKNEFIFHTGDNVKEVGIVLSGRIQIIKEDIWGNNIILAELSEGALFAEAFVLGEMSKIPLSVFAAEKSDILFLNKDRTITPCSAGCDFHFDVSKNMVKILASKNIFLTERVEHLAKRTLRDKILSYLSSESAKAGSRTFTIPFNRQDLSDYLAADRSALSSVLSKLRNEGIIEFEKNKFTLK